MSILTYHGKTKQCCEWVLNTYSSRQDLKDNGTVQQWLKDSRAFLNALEEDDRFDKALESTFGTDQ
jgi:hypothetical protein